MKTVLLLPFIFVLIANSLQAQPLQSIPRFKNIASDAFKNTEVTSYCYSNNNNNILFIGTRDGLFELQNEQVKRLQLPAGFNKSITSILTVGKKLLIGTNAGIVLYNVGSQSFSRLFINGRLHTSINNYCLLLSVDRLENLLFYTGYDTSAYYRYNLQTGKTTFLFNKSDGCRAYENDAKGALKKLWVVEPTGLMYYWLNNGIPYQQKPFFYGNNSGPALSIFEIIRDGNSLWCATSGGLLQFNTLNFSYRIIKPATGNSLSGIVCYKGKLVCAANDGLHIYDTAQKKWQVPIVHIADDDQSLPNNEISKIGLVKDDILIIATKKGLSSLLLDDANQLVFSLPNQIAGSSVFAAWDADEDEGLMESAGKLYFVNEQLKVTNKLSIKGIGNFTSAVKVSKGRWLAITGNKCFLIDTNSCREIKLLRVTINSKLEFISSIDNGSNFIVGGADGLFIINWATLNCLPMVLDKNLLYFYYQYAFQHQQYLVANTNFSYIDLLQKTADSSYNSIARMDTYSNISDHFFLGNQQYLLACSNGLKMLDIAEQKIKLVDAGFDKEIKKILKYKADTLLFAADGLYKLSNGKIITYQHPMQRLFSFAGSSGIYLHNDTLIFSNDDKIYRIGLQEKQVFNAAYTSLNVLLNGVKAPVTTIELGQNITIAINYINYHQAIQSDIFYKISNGKEWLKAAANGFSIDRLPAGNFTLTIKAVAGNTTWYSKQFVITVVPRWYQTIWFKVAMAVFVFILMVIFFMYLMNRQKLKADKKLAVQKQLSSFESRALRSQMNPHFIFNTLNSINSTVLENETEKASEFIMQFGKLMRQTLDNSQHEYITLDKELEALSIYLKLERQRLDNAFEYTINLDSAMDIADCLVPPLLLQPYVENAIWHGLVHKQPAGKLLIHVHANENQFTITITDNGIGIAKAGELQKHTNKIASYGTNITLQRLKMMNTNNTVEIKEIINTDGTSGGTSVQITIYQKL